MIKKGKTKKVTFKLTTALKNTKDVYKRQLLRQFGCSTTTATSSAFVQQRKKILPAALENLFQEFASQTARSDNYRGYKLLAIDGSDIQIATNPRDKASFFQTKEGVKPYNLLHLNALYNLLSHTYEDAIVYKAKEAGENKALIEMVDRSDFTTKTIVCLLYTSRCV